MTTPTPTDIQPRAPARRDLRGTWPQALLSLFGAITLILGIRWAFFEPYVIPSGSMIPTLLIHDHILVNKFSYGLRLPFTTSWFVHFGLPKRGDVVVFRSVEDPGVFIVKRVIGLPGETVRVEGEGQLVINDKPVPRKKLSREEAELRLTAWPAEQREEYLDKYDFYDEDLSGQVHLAIRIREMEPRSQGPYEVPQDALFMMGDNRDNSSDSRVWGTLPLDRVLGRASAIWLSCEETLHDANQLCDPQTMRWHRMGKGI